MGSEMDLRYGSFQVSSVKASKATMGSESAVQLVSDYPHPASP